MLEKLAFGSNAFTDGTWTIEEAIRAIASEGYKAVNILADAPLIWPLKLKKSQLKSIKNTLKETGLVVSGVNGFTAAGHYGKRDKPPGSDFGPSFADKNPALRAFKVKYTKQTIDLTEQLGAKNISISSGFPPKNLDPESVWIWMEEAIQETLDYAKIKGINLNIEFEPRLFLNDSDDAARLLKDLNHPNLGVNFDIGHSFVLGEDVPTQIKRFGEKINGADIEDIGMNEAGIRIHYHLVPGTGFMPLEKIFKAFREVGFEEKAYYTVELYSQSHRPLEAARESIEYFRALDKKLQKAN